MLRAILTEEEHGQLDETVRAHYTKTAEGKFLLDVGSVGGVALEDVTNLKSALSKERDDHEKFERQVKELTEKFGDLDPVAARDALKKIEEMGGLGADERVKAEIAAAKEQLEAKFTADLAAKEAGWTKSAGEYEDVTAALRQQLAREMVTSRALKAISAEGGEPKLLTPIVERAARVEQQEDGTFAVRIYDASGVVQISPKTGSTDPMTVDEFVSTLKKQKEFAPAFAGTAASGAGAGRSSGAVPGGAKVVGYADEDGKANNIEGIASGKVRVAAPGEQRGA